MHEVILRDFQQDQNVCLCMMGLKRREQGRSLPDVSVIHVDKECLCGVPAVAMTEGQNKQTTAASVLTCCPF